MMLFDSLEAVGSDRIAALVEYFEGYAEYILVALLLEDANELENPYHTETRDQSVPV